MIFMAVILILAVVIFWGVGWAIDFFGGDWLDKSQD